MITEGLETIALPIQNPSAIQQAKNYLNARFIFRYNVVTERIEYCRKPTLGFNNVDERVFKSLKVELDSHGIRINLTDLDTLLRSDYAKDFDPFKQYFGGLIPWDDGVDYISKLAETITTTDQDFWRVAFKRWIVAMVKSVNVDSVVNQQMIILTGGQGIGKSTWILSLVPNQLKDYVYSGKITPGDKDTMVYLKQSMMVIMDELSDFKQAEVSAVKNMITKEFIRFRSVYAKDYNSHVRRASFIGSDNSKDFLRDPTGSRRFLCFDVTSINYKEAVDLDKVYAQAYALSNNPDFQYWFEGKDIEYINARNKEFQEPDFVEDMLLEKLLPGKPGEIGSVHRSTSEIGKLIFEGPVQSLHAFHLKLSKLLDKHGFPHVKIAGKKGFWTKLANPLESLPK